MTITNRALYVAMALMLLLFMRHPHAQQPPSGPVPPDAGTPVVTVPGTTPASNPERPSTTAVATTEVPSPAAPTHYQDQIIWSLLAAQGFEYLKKTKWFQWVTPQSSGRIKAQFGFALALLTAAGVHFTNTGNIFDGGSLVITWGGLTFDIIKDVLFQWGSQQAWYLGLVKAKETL